MQEKAGSREEASVGIGSKLFGERTLSHVFSDLDSCVVHEDVATLGEICVGPDDTICASMLGGRRVAARMFGGMVVGGYGTAGG